MAITQFRSNRKPTGGMYKPIRKKKKRDFGRDFIPMKVGKLNTQVTRMLGGKMKHRLLQAEMINVNDKNTGKTQTVKVLEVIEHMDNPNYTRMGVITKGCIVKTDLGKVKVTSRPTQHGIVNGTLVEKK
ncbi:MAG: 30S ribosomal protein S8e [Candidatus Aenigmatarchaeota archaeon]